jgi:bile acid-coenzyme A ligase
MMEGDTASRDAEKRLIGYGARLRDLAQRRPADACLTVVSRDGTASTHSWADLDEAAARASAALLQHGAAPDKLVVVVLPNSFEHVAATYGAWKLGATVLPCNPFSPRPEREALLEAAGSFRDCLTIGDWSEGKPPDVKPDELLRLKAVRSSTPDRIVRPGYLIASGGTTGRPKITVTETPGAVAMRDGHADLTEVGLGVREGLVHLICTPLYHTSAFAWTHFELMTGNHVVLMERFVAPIWLDLVRSYKVNHAIVVPAIMQRLAEAYDPSRHDLSSLETLAHGGAICPEWLKRRWLEILPPRVVVEAFGGTEPIGGTVIDGEEWLRHPGSVGRPEDCDLMILDDRHRRVPAGTVGEIFMRPRGVRAPTSLRRRTAACHHEGRLCECG